MGIKPGTFLWGRMCQVHNWYRSRANRKGYPFEISKEDFLYLTQKNCFYCGAAPFTGSGQFIYNGLDRVDSSKGYTLKNCVPCCIICNRAKGAFQTHEFYTWLIKVFKHSKLR